MPKLHPDTNKYGSIAILTSEGGKVVSFSKAVGEKIEDALKDLSADDVIYGVHINTFSGKNYSCYQFNPITGEAINHKIYFGERYEKGKGRDDA